MSELCVVVMNRNACGDDPDECQDLMVRKTSPDRPTLQMQWPYPRVPGLVTRNEYKSSASHTRFSLYSSSTWSWTSQLHDIIPHGVKLIIVYYKFLLISFQA